MGFDVVEQPSGKKLTDSDAIEIRVKYRTGDWTMKRLAKRFGVGLSTIHHVVHYQIHAKPFVKKRVRER